MSIQLQPKLGKPAEQGPPGRNYRPELDGLRAIAVLAVIANHFSERILPSGYLGVDVFFVISGYVITLSLSATTATTFRSFAAGFFRRRIKRLAPALFVCVLVTAIVICLFNARTASFINTGILSLVGASNVYLYKLSANYFSESARLNPFTQTWSLAIEEQFYLLYPAFAWYFWLRNRQARPGRTSFLLVMLIATSASLLLYWHQASRNPNAAYFLLPARLWELSAGCLVFLIQEQQTRFQHQLSYRWSAWLLAGLLLLFAQHHLQQQLATSLCVLITAFIIMAPSSALLHQPLRQQWLVGIGLASYSLYLWHWSVISISRWTIGLHWWSLPLQLVLIGVLGCSSYMLIETKSRYSSWNPKALPFLLTYVSGLVLAGLALSWIGRPFSRIYLGSDNCTPFGLTTCKPASEPHAALTPYIEGSSIRPDSCIVATEKQGFTQAIIDRCQTGDPGSPQKRLILIGDSVAGNFSPLLNDFVRKRRAQATILVKYACRFELLPSGSSLPNQLRPGGCELANAQRWDYLENHLKPGDIVLVASADPKFSTALWQTYRRLAELSQGRGAHVIIAGPLPRDIFPVGSDDGIQRCINSSSQWFNQLSRSDCRAESSSSLLDYRKTNAIPIEGLKGLEMRYRNLHYWNLASILCDDTRCRSHLNGIRLYADQEHLSIPAVIELLLPDFQTFIRKRQIPI